MKYIKQALFFIVAFLVFFLFNYYIFKRMLGLISVDFAFAWALDYSIIFPLSLLLDREFHSKPTIVFSYITSAILGFLFLLFSMLIFLEVINLFFPVFNESLFIPLILISSLVSLYGILNGLRISVEKIEIDNFGRKIKFVQLSDIHIGTIRTRNFLERIIRQVNRLNPDFVLITGDLIDGTGKLTDETFEQFNEIKGPVFAIMGNHEFYEGENKVNNLLKKTKIKVLRNNFERFDGINIIGMDYSENRKYVARNLPKINYDKNLPSILMNHVPIGYKDAMKMGINLQISGHTHDGQLFPFSLLVKIFFPKKVGLYSFGKFSLYISPGTGTWGPPMRVGSNNEISFFELK
jgi:predicted MPP superfamily phosphohydrolase